MGNASGSPEFRGQIEVYKRVRSLAPLNFRGIYHLDINWKANSSILVTGLVSMMCWLIFVVAVTSLQNQATGGIFLIIAVLALFRFGQLLDKSLKDII